MREFSSLFFVSITILHLTFLVVVLIITELSRILGAALKKKPLYKLMYLAMAFIIGGELLFLLSEALKVYAYVSDIFGFILACFVTYYYWKWLPDDLTKG